MRGPVAKAASAFAAAAALATHGLDGAWVNNFMLCVWGDGYGL